MVLVVVLVFTIVSWARIVDKAWQFRRIRRQTIEFLKIFRDGRRPSLVYGVARRPRESPLAQLYPAAHQEVSGLGDVPDRVLDDADEGVPPERLPAANPPPPPAAAPAAAHPERCPPLLAD